MTVKMTSACAPYNKINDSNLSSIYVFYDCFSNVSNELIKHSLVQYGCIGVSKKQSKLKLHIVFRFFIGIGIFYFFL